MPNLAKKSWGNSGMNLNLEENKKKDRHVNQKYSIVELDLFKPSKKSYPEFDYEKICKDYLKVGDSSGDDERFHDREAEEFVKRLERKYGNKVDKRGRKYRFGCADDYIDKTFGYDLSDPFIDDTEAYDEHVPTLLDTVRGGFYVNKGKLEFKSKYADDSDSDASESAAPKRKPSEKKRRISSDEDEKEGSSQQPPSKVPCLPKASTLSTIDEHESFVTPVRLSSTGAAPTAKAGSTHVRLKSRSVQHMIKKRRLLGQPPSMKASQSLTVKAALGVKKKLKPSTRKSSMALNTDDLAGFLKDLTCGEEVPMDEVMAVVAKEVAREKSSNATVKSGESFDNTKKMSTDNGSSRMQGIQERNTEARHTLAQRVHAISKRSPGRPPGSTSHAKELPKMSDKLKAMVETYKQKTKEFGAPGKKIRLPPSLVDLCIKIEEQCVLERFNHAQRTRVFDLLAGWISVQRNSLYIRMKAQKDKRQEKITIADSECVIGTDDVRINDQPKTVSEPTDQTPKSDPLTSNASAMLHTTTAVNGPKELLTFKQVSCAPQNTSTVNSTGTASPEKSAKSELSAPKVSRATAASTGTNVTTKLHDPNSQKTDASSHLKSGSSSQQQQRLTESLTPVQINAALLAASQHPELMAQYQLAFNNIAKVNTSPTSASKGTALSNKASSSKPARSDTKGPLQKPIVKVKRASISAEGLPSTSQGQQKQVHFDPKTKKALKEISDIQALFASNLEKAMRITEYEYLRRKTQVKKDGPVPPKRFVWTDDVRSTLTRLVNALFKNLEMQGDPPSVISPTVLNYMFTSVWPLYKNLITFRELIGEILNLCPERKHLALVPEMNALVERSISMAKTQKTCDVKKATINVIMKNEKQSASRRRLSSGADVIPNFGGDNGRTPSANKTEHSETKGTVGVARMSSSDSITPHLGSKVQQNAVAPKQNSSNRQSSSGSQPKLTPGQKALLARETHEREKLWAFKETAEKAEKEREKLEKEKQRKLQEEKAREEEENRRRDEEAIKKWEQEESERLAASLNEDDGEVIAIEEPGFSKRGESGSANEDTEMVTDTELEVTENITTMDCEPLKASENIVSESMTVNEKQKLEEIKSHNSVMHSQAASTSAVDNINTEMPLSVSSAESESPRSGRTHTPSSQQQNIHATNVIQTTSSMQAMHSSSELPKPSQPTSSSQQKPQQNSHRTVEQAIHEILLSSDHQSGTTASTTTQQRGQPWHQNAQSPQVQRGAFVAVSQPAHSTIRFSSSTMSLPAAQCPTQHQLVNYPQTQLQNPSPSPSSYQTMMRSPVELSQSGLKSQQTLESRIKPQDYVTSNSGLRSNARAQTQIPMQVHSYNYGYNAIQKNSTQISPSPLQTVQSYAHNQTPPLAQHHHNIQTPYNVECSAPSAFSPPNRSNQLFSSRQGSVTMLGQQPVYQQQHEQQVRLLQQQQQYQRQQQQLQQERQRLLEQQQHQQQRQLYERQFQQQQQQRRQQQHQMNNIPDSQYGTWR